MRYYDPEVGRYVTRDPIGYGDGLNVYLYVGNNPVNEFDPLGLIAKQLWSRKSQDMMARGGILNNIGAFGIHLGMAALDVASIGTFSKNDRLADRNLAGEISDAQYYGGVAANTAVAAASIASGAAAGTAVAGALSSTAVPLVLQGTAAGAASGLAASTADVLGTRAGYGAMGVKYEGTAASDLQQIGLSTLAGGVVGAAGGVGAQMEWNRANSQVKGQWGENLARRQIQAEGGQILGEQVTVDTPGARVRPDFYVQSPERGVFVDAKAGPTARISGNQARGYGSIQSQGGIPRGANAAGARLTPGAAIGPTPVQVRSYPAGTYPGGNVAPATPVVIPREQEEEQP